MTIDLDTVLSYASPDTLAGLIADCKRYADWGSDATESQAIERRAMTALVCNVGDEEAARIVAEKVAAG